MSKKVCKPVDAKPKNIGIDFGKVLLYSRYVITVNVFATIEIMLAMRSTKCNALY
jgi:hypothetical protein